MNAPDWVAPTLSWVAVAVLMMILQVNISRESKKRQKMPRERPGRLLSWASLAYYARSTAADLCRFFVLLWAATKPATDFIGRVGLLVALAVFLIFGFRLPATVAGWQWLWGIPFGLIGVVAYRAIARRIVDRQPDDEPPDVSRAVHSDRLRLPAMLITIRRRREPSPGLVQGC